jgi:hypothetical protein
MIPNDAQLVVAHRPAQISGVDRTTGLATIEVYEVP